MGSGSRRTHPSCLARSRRTLLKQPAAPHQVRRNKKQYCRKQFSSHRSVTQPIAPRRSSQLQSVELSIPHHYDVCRVEQEALHVALSCTSHGSCICWYARRMQCAGAGLQEWRILTTSFLYCTVLCCTVLHCAVPYCHVLSCTVQHFLSYQQHTTVCGCTMGTL